MADAGYYYNNGDYDEEGDSLVRRAVVGSTPP
jgi:hypothetical protein